MFEDERYQVIKMDAVEEDSNMLDRIALHFGHNAFDLPSDPTFSSSHLHNSQHDFGDGDLSTNSVGLRLDHNQGFYGDVNLDSNLLDVNDSVIYGSVFPSLDGAIDERSSATSMSTSSVVDVVASSAIDYSVNDSKIYAGENVDLSNATSPNDDKKSCTCKDCGKVFNSVWYLKQHAVKHSSERPFKCKFCHKTYRFRSNLYQHKCPLRDRASELASAALGGDGSRKLSTAVDSPHPSSESSSSVEIGAGTAGSGITKTRKRRAWPVLTSSPPSTNPPTNGIAGHQRIKIRKGNFALGLDTVPEISTAASLTKLDAKRYTISSSSLESPSSPSSSQAMSKQPLAPLLSDEEIQKFLDRHKDKLHKCPKCKSFWPSREYLTRHMEWHNDESSRFRCVQCSETFVDEHRYGLHKQNHAPSALHICGRCRGKFCTQMALKKHAHRCSLMDVKANGLNGGVLPRSTTVVNGYRQALFIDPTPPPSPKQENGSDDKELLDSGENDDGIEHSSKMTFNEYTSTTSAMENGTNGIFYNCNNGFFDGSIMTNSPNGDEKFSSNNDAYGNGSISVAPEHHGNSNGILVSYCDPMFSTITNDGSPIVFTTATSLEVNKPIEPGQLNTTCMYNTNMALDTPPTSTIRSSIFLGSSHRRRFSSDDSSRFESWLNNDDDFTRSRLNPTNHDGQRVGYQGSAIDFQSQYGGPYFYHSNTRLENAKLTSSGMSDSALTSITVDPKCDWESILIKTVDEHSTMNEMKLETSIDLVADQKCDDISQESESQMAEENANPLQSRDLVGSLNESSSLILDRDDVGTVDKSIALKSATVVNQAENSIRRCETCDSWFPDERSLRDHRIQKHKFTKQQIGNGDVDLDKDKTDESVASNVPDQCQSSGST